MAITTVVAAVSVKRETLPEALDPASLLRARCFSLPSLTLDRQGQGGDLVLTE